MDERRKRRVALGVAAASVGIAGAIAATTGPEEPPEGATAMNDPEEKAASATQGMKHGAVVGSSWDMPVSRNDRVDFFIEFLMTERHDKMKLWLERLGKYAPMIQAELRARGMPEDLVFLAMMESGLDPNAYSVADAAGMWQFIEETGERYGLEVKGEVDERRDPVKSTGAALDYLQKLHDRFGSWYLAAAAYNTGENRIDRILRERAGGARGDEELYWKISPFIPRETRDYVPLMLAAGHIAKDPAKYGFTELEYQEPFEYDVVEAPAGTDFETIARAADSDAATIEALNPQLRKGRVPPRAARTIRIPAGTRGAFAANIEAALGGGVLASGSQSASGAAVGRGPAGGGAEGSGQARSAD